MLQLGYRKNVGRLRSSRGRYFVPMFPNFANKTDAFLFVFNCWLFFASMS